MKKNKINKLITSTIIICLYATSVQILGQAIIRDQINNIVIDGNPFKNENILFFWINIILLISSFIGMVIQSFFTYILLKIINKNKKIYFSENFLLIIFSQMIINYVVILTYIVFHLSDSILYTILTSFNYKFISFLIFSIIYTIILFLKKYLNLKESILFYFIFLVAILSLYIVKSIFI